jgi:hypothetical protein
LRRAAAPLPLAELSFYIIHTRFIHILVDILGLSVCIIYIHIYIQNDSWAACSTAEVSERA